MVLVYVLVCSLPFAMIFLVFFAIGIATANTVRTGKRMYEDMKPYINDLKSKADSANRTSRSITQHGDNINKTLEEINGRWCFIAEQFQEAKRSPVLKIVDIASRFAGKQ